MLKAMDALWSECFSELLPAGLHFLTTIPQNTRRRPRRYAIPHLTFNQSWAILPSFPGIAQSLPLPPTTAPKLLSIATTTPPEVCLRSSSPAVSSVILAALAANLHPSFASLLNYSSIFPFLNLCSIPKKVSKVPLYLLICFLSVLQVEPFSNAHLISFPPLSFQFGQLL